MYQTIRYEKNGNIGIATINRPEALNALNSTVISELEQLIGEVEKDTELGAFILTGEGRSFVAGADIGEQYPMDVAAGRKWGQRGSALFRRIEKLEIPTIAAVNGFAPVSYTHLDVYKRQLFADLLKKAAGKLKR